jgi:hypothetical protein
VSDHVSKLSPRVTTPTAEIYETRLRDLLKPYCLEQMIQHEYVILFEGWTDVSYAQVAIKKHKEESGIDLLTAGTVEQQSTIFLGTPGENGNPARGGTKQMVRLARELQPFVFTFPFVKGIAFVFDHDEAGLEADNQVTAKECGYQKKKHTFTLDPKLHPNSCAEKQVCVEDLLSLQIQHQFFEQGDAYCEATYFAGKVVRYRWATQSKDRLRDFVVQNASQHDLHEIFQLIKRVRYAWGLAD